MRLNVSRVTCRRFIEPRLAAFLAAYPEVHLDIVVDDGFSNIVEGGFDAGIRLGESLDREMIAVRISGEERVAVVGSPAYFAVRGKPMHPRDLHRHECVNYRRISGGDVYRWEFTDAGKDFELAVNGRVVCNDGDLMVRAALDGVGRVHVLESMVERELAEKRLVRVLGDYCTPFPGHFLYYPSRAHVARKLKVLVAFLRPEGPRGRRKAPAPGVMTGARQRRQSSSGASESSSTLPSTAIRGSIGSREGRR